MRRARKSDNYLTTVASCILCGCVVDYRAEKVRLGRLKDSEEKTTSNGRREGRGCFGAR